MSLLLLQTIPLARVLKNPLELSHDSCGTAYVRVKDSNWVKLNDLALHTLELQKAQDLRYSHPFDQMGARYNFLKIENLYNQSDKKLEDGCFLTCWFVKLCNCFARCFRLPLIRDEIDYHGSVWLTLSPQAAERDNFSTLYPAKKYDSMRPDWPLYDNSHVYDIMEEVL